jgi:hypothetical protein
MGGMLRGGHELLATLGVGAGGGGGGGIETAATWGALPAATGSGVQRVVLDSGLRVTDCAVEGEYYWLPSEAVRKADGTLYALAWARDGGGEKCRLRPGDAVPGGWTLAGTCTTTGGVVTINGYINTVVVSTEARALTVVQYHALPGGSVAEAGVAGGCVVGGTGRWVNTRLTSGGIVSHGLYQSTASKGRLLGDAGLPIFGLLEQSNAGGPVRAWSAGGEPGQVAACERTDMNSGGAYFQIMSVDLAGTGVSLELDFAGLVVMS